MTERTPDSSARAGRNATKGFFYAVVGTLMVSTNYVTAKYGTQGFHPAAFSLVWTTAAGGYAFAMVVASGRLRELALPARAVPNVVAMGLMSGPMMLCAWHGLALLDPGFAAFLWRFSPVLIILLSAALLHEGLKGAEVFALGLMVLGGTVSAVGRWHVVGPGLVLTLIACALTAAQHLLAKTKAADVQPPVLAFYRVALGVPLIAAWAFAAGQARFAVAPRYWLVTLLGASLGPSASYVLTYRSYRHWELSRAALVRTAQPLFVLPLALVCFGKLPASRELLGGVLILGGALLIARLHLAGRPAAISGARAPHGQSTESDQ